MRPAGQIHLLIADDHPVVRCGLRAAVEGMADILVVGAVASLKEVLELCRTEPPDVILLDLRLGTAEPEQAVTSIHGECPAACILMVSTDEAGDDLCRALAAGAAGAVSRDVRQEELLEAIRALAAGSLWVSSEVAERLSESRASGLLSEDERACLRLRAAGKTCTEIAPLLQWPESQVRDCLRRVRQKLGARNQTDAVLKALRRGIIPLE